MATANIITVRDVAEILGISESRVRQICIRENIGTVYGSLRLFTPADVRKLEALPRQVGRPPKSA